MIQERKEGMATDKMRREREKEMKAAENKIK